MSTKAGTQKSTPNKLLCSLRYKCITEGSDDNLNTDEHNLGMTIAKNKYIFSKMLLSI